MKALHALALFIFVFSSACNRLTNDIDPFEQQCGEAPRFDIYQYFRAIGPDGDVLPTEDLRLVGAELNATRKGCIKIPRALDATLEISYPKRSSGVTIHPLREKIGSLVDIKLKAFAYKNVISTCPQPVATRGPVLEPQVDLNDQDLAGYAWTIELLDAQGVRLTAGSETSPSGNQKLSLLDVRPVSDGSYTLRMRFKQLHSVDRLENTLNCQIFIDRKTPVFSLGGLKRVDGMEASPSIIAPGETIRILVDDPGTSVHVFGCLGKIANGKVNDCEYQRLDDRILLAPASGEWVLRGFAVDEANNKGPIVERSFQIVDSNAVSAIKVLTQQADFAVSTGQGMTSILSAVQSYERYRALGSKEEMSAVHDDVRRALLEASALPREELYFALARPEQRQGVGMMDTDQGLALLSTVSNEVTKELNLSFVPVNGNAEYKISLEPLQTLYPTVSTCGDKSAVVVFGTAGVMPIVKGRAGNFIKFTGRLHYSGYGLTSDCRYVYFSELELGEFSPKRTTVIDMRSGAKFIVNTPLAQAYRAVGSVSILAKQNSDYVVVDMLSGETSPAFTTLTNANIKAIQATSFGELGVLTKDNVLHLFTSDLNEISQIADVDSIYPASTSKEIIAVGIGNFSVKIVNAELGKVAFQVNDAFKDIAYLGADRDYLVFKDYNVDRVKIWSRNGYLAPEQIYSLDSRLSNVWIADPGYLYLENVRFAKLLQMNSDGVFLKKAPPQMMAVGMEFLDNDRLAFKSQSVRNIDWRSSNLESSANIWNLYESKIQSEALPVLQADEALNISSFAGYSRDVKRFQNAEGRTMLAIVFGRGSLGIVDPDLPGILVLQNKICRDWAFDLDIAPNGKIGALACAEGSVRVFDLEKLSVLASFDTRNGPPINIGFDATSESLFITDQSQGLYKVTYATVANRLEERLHVANAGMRLAMNPSRDEIAVLGSSAQLIVYDTDLVLKRAPIPTNSKFSLLALSLTYDPTGKKVFGGMYDGAITEIDLISGRTLAARFSVADDGALGLKVSPDGKKLAFYGKGKVQVWDLSTETRYENICRWLKPRLRYFSSLPGYSVDLCNKAPSSQN